MSKQLYYEEVAQRFVEALRDGTSPLLRKWEPGELQRPFNPVSGTRYRGANFISLMLKGYNDPRWATYKQAQSQGWQVRKGERGTKIQFYKFTQEVQKRDESGLPVINADGEPVKELVKLERPIVWHGTVFNVSQMEQVPKLEVTELDQERLNILNQLIENSEVTLYHDQRDSAYYKPSTDTIHLPKPDSFNTEAYYYEVVMHEFAHATGHESRLARDIRHPFGSKEYAREELRAEIASFMLCAEYGLSHSLGHHVSYVESWVTLLRDEPREILDASRDADRIVRYAEGLMNEKNVSLQLDQEPRVDTLAINASLKPGDRIYLAIPYREKDKAKAVAKENDITLRWDRQKKQWWMPAGSALKAMAHWLPTTTARRDGVRSRIEEFSQLAMGAGLSVDADLEADGKIYRVLVEGGKPGSKDGAFALYENSEGHLGGWYQNFRTGERGSWSAVAGDLEPTQKVDFGRMQAERTKQLAEATREAQEEVANGIREELKELGSAAGKVHEYLKQKQIDGEGLLVDKAGQLVVPLVDVDGQVWSTQTINKSGQKLYRKGGRKKELFAVASPEHKLKNHSPIFIAEGYATAATAAKALNASTVAAMDAYNLESVAMQLRARYPDSPIIILGDDDAESKSINVGRKYANRAAKSVDGIVCFPDFGEQGPGKERKDFNDLARVKGAKEVSRQIEQCYRLGWEQQQALRMSKCETKEVRRGLKRGAMRAICGALLAFGVGFPAEALPRIGTAVQVLPERGRFEVVFETRSADVSSLAVQVVGTRVRRLRVHARKVLLGGRGFKTRYYALSKVDGSGLAGGGRCLQVAVEQPESVEIPNLPDLTVLQESLGISNEQREELLSLAQRVVAAVAESKIESDLRCEKVPSEHMEEIRATVARVLGLDWNLEDTCSLIDSPYWEVFLTLLPSSQETRVGSFRTLRALRVGTKAYRYLFTKDACESRKARYQVRIRGRARGKPVRIATNEIVFSGARGSSIKPASDGKFAPDPLLLMEHIGACGVRQTAATFTRRGVFQSLLQPADLITHRGRIFVRTPIAQLMNGTRSTFVMSTGIAAYGVCFKREARRQIAHGYPL